MTIRSSETLAENAHAEDTAVPAICRACRFGRGEDRECTLIDAGEQDLLFSEGPCDLAGRVQAAVLRLIRRRYPFARSMEEDLSSEVLLQIMESRKLLVPSVIKRLPVLERRLADVVRNAVIDRLRHHQLITRIRCGACANFDKEVAPPGCQLPFLPDFTDQTAENPWYGARVERTTDPRRLEPPCDVFEWRRPDTHDIFEEEIPGMDADGHPRERAVALLIQGIDRVSRQDPGGMRSAAALFWHYLRGKEVKEMAKNAGVSEKTIKRLLADGRERLLDVLTNQLGVRDLAEVF